MRTSELLTLIIQNYSSGLQKALPSDADTPRTGNLCFRHQPERLAALTTFRLLAPSALLQIVAHVFDIHSHSLSPASSERPVWLLKLCSQNGLLSIYPHWSWLAAHMGTVFPNGSSPLPPSSYSLPKFRLLLSCQPDLSFKSWTHHHYNPLHVSHRPCWTDPVSREETV